MTPFDLVVFDCDGVLVDSEPIAVRVSVEELAQDGYVVTAQEFTRRFVGMSQKSQNQLIAAEIGRDLPADLASRIEDRILAAFDRDLRPLPDMAEALRAIPQARCVASGSTLRRIRHSLTVTGLLPFLDPHLFSATMVVRGKPAPDLFLLAARTLGFAPDTCLVIEDSVAGVTAGVAAGMHVLGFTGGGHVVDPAAHAAMLYGAGAHHVFGAMADLPALAAAGRGD